MNITAIIAMLIQTGICAPVDFNGKDGSQLTVLVCPMLKPAPAAVEPQVDTSKPTPSLPVRRA